MLESDHMQVLYVCCADPTEFQSSHQAESWFKVFQKMKDYLLVSICDPDLCDQGLFILHNFLTADTLKFQIYDVRYFSLTFCRIAATSTASHLSSSIMARVTSANRNSRTTSSVEWSNKLAQGRGHHPLEIIPYASSIRVSCRSSARTSPPFMPAATSHLYPLCFSDMLILSIKIINYLNFKYKMKRD